MLAVSATVDDVRLVLDALSALLFSSAEVMLTPFVPVSVALPPAAMSEPLMVRAFPAATVRFPPLVSVVPLKVWVVVLAEVVLKTAESSGS